MGMKHRGRPSPPSWPLAVFLHPTPFTATSLSGAFTLRGKDRAAHSAALTDQGCVLLSK